MSDRRGPVVAVSSHRGAYNFCRFLADWTTAAERRWLAWLPHDRWQEMTRGPSPNLPPGTYLIGDFEYLSADDRAWMADAVDRLRQSPDRYRFPNSPNVALSRAELHQALLDAGINDYRSRLAVEPPPPGGWRFPVFIRSARDHTGALSPLLHSQIDLEREIVRLEHNGLSRSKALVIEFMDPAGPLGLTWKFGVFRVGDRLIPRHAFGSSEWMIRNESEQAVDPEVRRQEWSFIENPPHMETIRRAFDVAGLEYGRVDFGVCGGRVQVWEANSNPAPLTYHQIGGSREPLHRWFRDHFIDALDGLRLPDAGPLARAIRWRCEWERLPWAADGRKRRARRDGRRLGSRLATLSLSILKRLPGNRYPWSPYEQAPIDASKAAAPASAAPDDPPNP